MGYCTMNETKLQDERFPWIERRRKTVRLAQIYDRAGFPLYAERAGACATWLQFNVALDGRKSLRAANFCRLRLCPMCSARRAKRSALKLSQVMDAVEAEQHCRYLFLTLTVRNCSGEALGDTLKLLTRGWYKLMDHRRVSVAVGGWFRALEITRNPQTGEYHPHIHAILAVPAAYFASKSRLYITQKEWRERWQTAIGADYDPSVRISVTKAKGGCDSASRSATLESAKYTTKDSEYIDPKLSLDQAAAIVTDYTNALYRRRLTAFGGWMKDAARRFDADDLDTGGDLIHADDDRVRDDVADLVETYNWHFGSGDYILADRQLNPLRVVHSDTGEIA